MSWVETLPTQQVTKDVDDKRRGIRTYRVWDYARTQILADPTAILNDTGQGLPGYNSPWEGMTLDTYQVTPAGNIYDVAGLYSNDRRFRLPAGPPRLHRSFTGSFATENVPIPFAKWSTTKVVTLVQNGTPLTQDVHGWVFDEQGVEHKFERIGQQVYLDAATVDLALEAIANQANKVHFIRGRYYLFEPGDYAEETDGKWRMQYNWTRDPGTPEILAIGSDVGPPPSSVPVFPVGNIEWPRGSGRFYSRPPFMKLVIVPNRSGNPEDLPEFWAMKSKDDSDLLGWSTLPGFTP